MQVAEEEAHDHGPLLIARSFFACASTKPDGRTASLEPERAFRIALAAVDFPDQPFVVTLPRESEDDPGYDLRVIPGWVERMRRAVEEASSP